MRALGPAGAALLGLYALLAAPAAGAQRPEPEASGPGDPRVGVAAGAVRGSWDTPPTIDAASRTGWAVGIFADVPTPLRPLEVRVEARWLRRGGDLVGGGGAESDLLDVPLAVGARLSVGPASLFPSAGVDVAYPLSTRRSAAVAEAFGEESGARTSAFVGLAADVDLPRGLRLGAEARWSRGLGPAFRGPAGTLEQRSREVLVRLSRPLG